MSLDLKALGFPILIIKLNAEKISIQSRALLEISEPYKSYVKMD